MYEKTIVKCCVSSGLFIYQAKKFCSEGRISAKLFKFVFHPVLVSWTYTKYESSQALSKQHMSSFGLACVIKKKVHLSFTDDVLVRYWRKNNNHHLKCPKQRSDTPKGTILHNYDILAKCTHSKHKDVVFSLTLYWSKNSTNYHTRVCAPCL